MGTWVDLRPWLDYVAPGLLEIRSFLVGARLRVEWPESVDSERGSRYVEGEISDCEGSLFFRTRTGRSLPVSVEDLQIYDHRDGAESLFYRGPKREPKGARSHSGQLDFFQEKT